MFVSIFVVIGADAMAAIEQAVMKSMLDSLFMIQVVSLRNDKYNHKPYGSK